MRKKKTGRKASSGETEEELRERVERN